MSELPKYKFEDVYQHIGGKTVDFPITSLPKFLTDWQVNLAPPYQRGHVWTKRQKSAFVGYILEGGFMPPLILNETGPDNLRCDVVDGKQRLTAATSWVLGELPAKLYDGRIVWPTDFDEVGLRRIGNYVNFKFQLVRLDELEVMKLYLRLNRGGTVHTKQELRYVETLIKGEEQHGRDQKR